MASSGFIFPLDTVEGFTPVGTKARPSSLGVSLAMQNMQTIGRVLDVLTLILVLSLITTTIGAFLFKWNWFLETISYRFLIPIFAQMLVMWFVHRSWRRNLRNPWTLLNLMLVFWTLYLLAMSIWLAVDILAICPQDKPNYCTNTVDETIETGFWVYSVGFWVSTVGFFIELGLMASATRNAYRLTNFDGLSNEAAEKLLMEATMKQSNIIKSIGSSVIH